MLSQLHHFQDLGKEFKISMLGRSQWILLKEGYDPLAQIHRCPNTKPIERFFVIIVTTIYEDTAAAKDMLKGFQG